MIKWVECDSYSFWLKMNTVVAYWHLDRCRGPRSWRVRVATSDTIQKEGWTCLRIEQHSSWNATGADVNIKPWIISPVERAVCTADILVLATKLGMTPRGKPYKLAPEELFGPVRLGEA